MSEEMISLEYPGGLMTKMKIDDGEFNMITDYQVERGGNYTSYSPWKVFLSAILSCQGVNLAKYCREHDIDYSQVTLELHQMKEGIKDEEFPEYHLKIQLPEDFPEEHIKPMIDSFMDCPVVNHLTDLKPIFKTYVNDEFQLEKRR